jgi:murein DD-endopeptidase MepM/ murein hydrolase activator NlpD
MSRKLVVRRLSHSSPLPPASGHFLRLKQAGALAIAGLLAAGCSADISRFDGQGYGLTDSSSAKIPPQGMRSGEASKLGDNSGGTQSPGGAYMPPPRNAAGNANPGGNVRMSALPDPVVPPAPPPSASVAPRQNSIAPRPAMTAAPPKPIAAGATIEVAAGDTLFGLAKKHAVPVNELMTVNGLTAPAIKPGQKLVLPASRSIARAAIPQKPIQRTDPVRIAGIPQTSAPVSPIPVATAPVAPAPSDWGGSYTVKPGESLYGIARANRVPFAQLQQVNGIADATKVKPGTVLKMPGTSTTAALGAEPAVAPIVPVAAPPASKVAGAAATTETPRVIQSATKPVIINQAQPAAAAPQQVAAIDPSEASPAEEVPAAAEPKAVSKKGTETAAAGTSALGGQKFRWPVKGRVIANYGPRTDSTHNDGINIAVPMGTEVLAAEQGVVAYAGSELKGYGNLILLRHDNGWVTAYAHNEEILVKRGDKVKRGQSIAKAGKTGTVDQPQVHFEIRQGQKPVDPMPHMEKL